MCARLYERERDNVEKRTYIHTNIATSHRSPHFFNYCILLELSPPHVRPQVSPLVGGLLTGLQGHRDQHHPRQVYGLFCRTSAKYPKLCRLCVYVCSKAASRAYAVACPIQKLENRTLARRRRILTFCGGGGSCPYCRRGRV